MQNKRDELNQLFGAICYTMELLIEQLEKYNGHPFYIELAKQNLEKYKQQFNHILTKQNEQI